MSGIMNPLKCSIAVIPTWTGRRSPLSKLGEMKIDRHGMSINVE
ncbi:MAG: hypothetical protein P5702_07180 [Limnospira sp. PMC 1291.21]|nr:MULTISPECIES: hypothetical protein [unclassified Limnospira]EKD09403.1 hypothetical protein SPLC1_S208060 [Arthrospira platensis C1]MDC0839432.1 hypothetical protein [Limnoraphis robusta]MDT9177269.1 hypothetical protein [Limnospira sp. PMC 1238.20]MDT9238762.1 hypothetical protein [Limnospira sp. PMC 1261.20]MDY7053182.1 hypothetical protein [Limnospira fusiformis LS22]